MILDTNQYKTGESLRPFSFDSIALQPYYSICVGVKQRIQLDCLRKLSVLILQNSANGVLLNEINRLSESVSAIYSFSDCNLFGN